MVLHQTLESGSQYWMVSLRLVGIGRMQERTNQARIQNQGKSGSLFAMSRHKHQGTAISALRLLIPQ